ncbi:MAG: endonuclease/exonuclease/phosphatase family protein [bacterium]|nr:endonuclease/exonuclease/phosphatase family protein [bacterium]
MENQKNTRTVKIISWNIAGGRKVKSGAMFDYESENLEYFANEIKKLDPDIVCLQENLLNKKRSVGKDISHLINVTNIYDTSANHIANHIDPEYELGMTILSKDPFENAKSTFYPNPSFPLLWKDGSEAAIHNKFMQEVAYNSITIINTQMLPIRIWGYNYSEEPGKSFSDAIQETFKLSKLPLLFCGDFNTNDPQELYNHTFDKLGLKDALNSDETRPGTTEQFNKPDHIFYSPEFKLIKSEIVKTQTDHYLCFAEFEI